MTRRDGLLLNLNFTNAGNHAGAWRSPEVDAARFGTVEHYVKVARLAEEGGLDAIFLSDSPGVAEDSLRFRPVLMFDPAIALAGIAAQTEHLGLIATVSASFSEPYNVARTFATLDHASGGRVGVNIVTNTSDRAAQNFGQAAMAGHDERYARADEFALVLRKLWTSWEAGAILSDAKAGEFYDPSRIHAIDHAGTHFSVRGPLTVPRSPQGYPVILQAGGSDAGRALAARHADAVFCVAHDMEEARELGGDIRRRAEALNRTPGDILLLPGVMLILGSTDEEALAREQRFNELVPIASGLQWLGQNLGFDASALDPDAPLPETIVVPEKGSRTIAAGLIDKARRENLTVRQLIHAQGGGGTIHRKVRGGPETIADHLDSWFRAGVADGFNLNFDLLPTGVEAFVEEVVPLLRARGVFPERRGRRTLRQRFGLPVPSQAI